jgi:hypothetical protein
MNRVIAFALLLSALAFGCACEGYAQGMTLNGRPPFYATQSNTVPLVIGMDVSQASAALRQPLEYLSGPPRSEIYLARPLRSLGASGGLIDYDHRLFLQFRNGRLAGWKEDYGLNWMW